jgi:two-component system, LytTR family, sensor kinase
MSRSTLIRGTLLFVFTTMVGLLNFGIVSTSDLASRGATDLRVRLLYEMTGAYAVLFLLPFLIWFIRRVPIGRNNWWSSVPVHLLATIVFGVSHTLLMWGSRSVFYRIFDWGTYDYGVMRYRLLMEYQKQFVLYWLVFGLIAFIDYVRRNREREVRATELERRLTEARLDALKMQLNPHFLFNTLNTISSWVHEDPDLADEMIAHLSDFLRLTLRHGDVQQVPLGREIEFLDAYLSIMRARFRDRLDVTVEIPEDLREALVPHLILQPLVENSITHATLDSEGPASVRISAARAGDRLCLLVDDEGPGIEGDPDEAISGGIGLTNTRERLRALHGDDYHLGAVNRPEGGLRLRIEVPLRFEERGGAPARAPVTGVVRP